jgi:hypothetical protein
MTLTNEDYALWTIIHILTLSAVLGIAGHYHDVVIPLPLALLMCAIYWAIFRLFIEALIKSIGPITWIIVSFLSAALILLMLEPTFGIHLTIDFLVIYQSIHLSYMIGKCVRPVKVIKE